MCTRPVKYKHLRYLTQSRKTNLPNLGQTPSCQTVSLYVVFHLHVRIHFLCWNYSSSPASWGSCLLKFHEASAGHGFHHENRAETATL